MEFCNVDIVFEKKFQNLNDYDINCVLRLMTYLSFITCKTIKINESYMKNI